MASSLALGGGHAGLFSCSLVRKHRPPSVQNRGARIRPASLPPARRGFVGSLFGGGSVEQSFGIPIAGFRRESERMGFRTVSRAPMASSRLEDAVISPPQSVDPNPKPASSLNSTEPPSPPEPSAESPPLEETSHFHEAAEQQSKEERVANGAKAGPSGQNASSDAPPSDEESEGEPMFGSRTLREVCDKLIEVFTVEKKEVMDWKRLLALSSEWESIRPKFYTHLKRRAKEVEADGNPEYALQLYSLQRRLNKVEDEMAAHDKLLADVEAETDWNTMVVRRREEFTQDFFQHIRIRADSQFNQLGRRDELANLSAKLLTVVQMHDNIQKDEALMLKAEEKFLGLLDSPDLTTLDSKIDELAKTGGIDPALLLTMSKAYSAAKDTHLVKDEVKDIMAHMYFKAQQTQQMYVPKEVRILRYLITIEDPTERYRALEDAFEPGDESDPWDQDENALLYTTPENLYNLVSNILVAYFKGTKNSTMLKEAAALMRPKVIDRIKLLKDMIQKDFL